MPTTAGCGYGGLVSIAYSQAAGYNMTVCDTVP